MRLSRRLTMRRRRWSSRSSISHSAEAGRLQPRVASAEIPVQAGGFTKKKFAEIVAARVANTPSWFRSVSLSRNFKRQDNTLGLLKSLRLSAGPTMNRRGGGNHGSGPIPDRWLQYLPIGKHIEQTRFLPLKCPLDKKFFMRNRCSDEQLFTIDCLLAMAGNVNKKIGLIIDLTNTHRYYNPEEFTSQGIQHVKLQCPGHEVDGREDIVREFIQIVDNYLAVAPPDTLIGVHCTHGLNRTGYLIGRYLIQKGDWNADEYLQMFEHCRGHPIEREAYKAKLRWAQEQRDAILKQNADT